VVFGCPRTLTKSAADKYDISCTSYRHGNDFVTTVSRRSWGFRHPVELDVLKEYTGSRTWDDHAIHLYIDALKGIDQLTCDIAA